MATLSISLAQMNIVMGDVNANKKTATKMLADAAKRGSNLMLLPELWTTGYDWENHLELAQPINGDIFTEVSGLAARAKVSIVGSMLEKRGQQVANSAPFFAANGRSMGVYRKVHLFRLFDEDRYLQPGASPLVMNLPWGPTGVAICYDLRFPELFRRYALEDAVLTLLISEWPLERIEHWRALIRARAIENQMYIAAVNSAGQTGDTVFGGHSMIVDPWGKTVVEAGEDPTLLTGEIDLDRVKETRKKIPILEDRRPEIY